MSPDESRPAPPTCCTCAGRPAIIAVVGNPNTGKTALFNALTGFKRHVANYPGVTVDVARGPLRCPTERAAPRAHKPPINAPDSAATTPRVELLDLPGTYSLAATSPDEMVLCDALCNCGGHGPRPDAILVVVDASNLRRNLYLTTQVCELGLPVVVALNMIDIARRRQIDIDAALLSQRLGAAVVPVAATQPETVPPLVCALHDALNGTPPPATRVPLPTALCAATERVQAAAGWPMHAAMALRVLADEGGHAESQYVHHGGDRAVVQDARQRLRDAGITAGPAEVRARYAWIDELLKGVVRRTTPAEVRRAEWLDRLVTHRVGGVLLLLAVLYGLFYAIYAGSQPAMEGVEWLFGRLGDAATAVLPTGVVQSLVVDGLLAGVGGVLAFLPQILMLFLFIGVLEDTGYMARAAFMVDRLMRPLGLSGRSFIPLLTAFACTVPAILGARAIACRRERFVTIMIAPFMSCSARLPVYVLLIGAFVPLRTWAGGWLRLDALVMLGMYLVGIVVAIPIALLMRKTLFAGPSAGFLLELPGYRLPRLRTVWQRMYLAGRAFVVRAGTIILLVNMVVWALGYFPRSSATLARVEAERAAAATTGEPWDDATFAGHLNGAYLRASYLGRLGHAIEPALRPLGWDWRIGVGVLASFPAREVIIATLGTVANLGDAETDTDSLSAALQAMKRDDSGAPLFTLPVALSVMVFFALCAQCGATLVVIAREMGSWVWAAVSFTGMTTLAYLAAWAVSAGGRWVGL